MVSKLATTDRRLAAMAKLIPVMREKAEQQLALVEEFEAIVGGGPTIGEKLKELETHYSDLWAWRYGEPYAWTDYPKTRGQWKTLLKKIPIEPLRARVANYIRNGEDFYASKRHPFGLFVATVNQHVTSTGEVAGLSERPTGCKHDPPCRDQFAHTKKRQAEATT